MIHPDINKARALPASFYRDMRPFHAFRESLFRDAWHVITPEFVDGMNAIPATILPGYLNEPIVLTLESGEMRCLSNVCTHRGNLLVSAAGKYPLLRCRYHGRCFGLDGMCRSQAGMEGLADFPDETDHLTELEVSSIGPISFTRIRRRDAFDDAFTTLRNTMSWYDFEALEYQPELSRIFSVKAHWTLYVDNYLEGYHVPFVHPGLDKSIDPQKYEYMTFEEGALQIGRAREEEGIVFDELEGDRVFAYYWWIFPNLMVNMYPWGVSVNSVEPISIEETRIRFITFLRRGKDMPDLDGLHQTEFEDEAIVEQVQRGISSSFYQRGRYAPEHEVAVHHFHRLLSRYLDILGT